MKSVSVSTLLVNFQQIGLEGCLYDTMLVEGGGRSFVPSYS